MKLDKATHGECVKLAYQRVKGKVEEEEPLKETGQDLSTGRKKTERAFEKVGGINSAEC